MLLGAQLVGNAGLFVAVLLIARALGPEGRGTTAFILVTAQVVAILAGVGLPQATMVQAAQPAQRALLLTNLILFATAAAGVIAVVASFGLLLLGELRPSAVGPRELLILIAAIIANALFTAGDHFLLGCGRLVQRSLVVATWPWLYVAVVVAFSRSLGLDAALVVVAWTVCQAAAALWLLGACVRGIGLVRPQLALLVTSLRFGLRLWAGSVAQFLNFRVDQILMGFISTQTALGIYAVAVNVAELLLYLPGAVSTALLPLIARSVPARRLGQTVEALRFLFVATAASVVVAVLIGPPLMPLVFGPAFADSVRPFLWLLPGAFGFAAMRVFTSSLLGASAPTLASYGAVTSLFVGLALDLALVPPFGADGAAAAASIAFLAGGLAAGFAYRARTPFAWRVLFVRGAPEARLQSGVDEYAAGLRSSPQDRPDEQSSSAEQRIE